MKLTRFFVTGSLLASLVATPVLASEGRMDDEMKDRMMERKENARMMGTCLRDANEAFRGTREGKWKSRKDAVRAAWDKYVAARKAANAAFEIAAKAARESKDEAALKSAKSTRRSALEAAHDTWVTERRSAIEGWQGAWKTAHDAFKAAQEKCRQK